YNRSPRTAQGVQATPTNGALYAAGVWWNEAPLEARSPRGGKNQEQQLQGLSKTNKDETKSYCLDSRYVIPQAEFIGTCPDQNEKTPDPKNDHREAAESDQIG